MVRGNGPRSGAGQHRGEATRSMLCLYGRDWCCKGPNLYYNKGETDKRKMREKWSYSVQRSTYYYYRAPRECITGGKKKKQVDSASV